MEKQEEEIRKVLSNGQLDIVAFIRALDLLTMGVTPELYTIIDTLFCPAGPHKVRRKYGRKIIDLGDCYLLRDKDQVPRKEFCELLGCLFYDEYTKVAHLYPTHPENRDL